MNTSAKTLASMRQNPRDWQISELQTVARQKGITWRHDGSSHCVFITKDGRTLPVPAHRPIKPIYIKKFLNLIDGV
jgi:hypothetical protein